MNVLKIGHCVLPSGGSGVKAQTGVVQAWSQSQLPPPLAFFPLASDLNSSTLPRYAGVNKAADFVTDASFGQVLSCDKVRSRKASSPLPWADFACQTAFKVKFYYH